MKGQYVKLGFLVLLFFCIYSRFIAVQAEVVWSDDFDDGDYDGWEVKRGNWSAENGFLRISDPGDIYRPSTTSVGTWSFDVYVTPVGSNHFSFLFMSDTPASYIPLDLLNFNGYLLMIYAFPDGRSSTLDLYSSTGSWKVKRELLEIYDVGMDLSYRWHHMDITRDDEGRICVYLNRRLVIDLVDRNSNSSSFFQFLSETGPAIDNIVVKDYVDPPHIQEWSGDFDDGVVTDRGIRFNSTIAYGTWSYDVYLTPTINVLNPFIVINGSWLGISYDYQIEIKPLRGATEFIFVKETGQYPEYLFRLEDHYIYAELTERWHHIDITRDIQGKFYVYFNGELIMHALDNSLKTSVRFSIMSIPHGYLSVENMTVRNVVDIFPSLPFDVSVEISEEEVTQGEDVLVSIQARDDYGFTIPIVSVDVSLEGKKVDVNALGWGVYEALLDTSELTGMVELVVTAEKAGFISSESTQSFEVVSPASFVTSGLSIEPGIAEKGRQVSVTAEVSNVGGQRGSYTLTIDIEGVTSEEITVTLDPETSETVFFEFLAVESGTFTVDLDGMTETFTVVDPASFEISNLIIEPDSVKEGESVTISVECSNVGGISGSYDVVLMIDGETEDTSTVTVDAAESTTASFDVTASQSGSHSVEVIGLTGSYTVLEQQQGIPGYQPESVFIGLISGALILWILRRNRPSSLSPER